MRANFCRDSVLSCSAVLDGKVLLCRVSHKIPLTPFSNYPANPSSDQPTNSQSVAPAAAAAAAAVHAVQRNRPRGAAHADGHSSHQPARPTACSCGRRSSAGSPEEGPGSQARGSYRDHMSPAGPVRDNLDGGVGSRELAPLLNISCT